MIEKSDEVVEKVKEIVADIAECETAEIGLDAHFFKDLEIDSIKAIELTVAMERAFGVSVRDDQIKNITTVRQASDLTKQLLDKKSKS